MKTTKFSVFLNDNIDKDIDDFLNQLTVLLIKYNKENCIYKYKYTLTILSNNVTFSTYDVMIPTENIDLFEALDIPLYIIDSYNERSLSWESKYKGIKIYSNEIKFYKRFKNFQLPYLRIVQKVKDMLLSLKTKGIISIEVTIKLSHR